MTVEIVGRSRDNAILLIAAARELGLDETEIRTTSGGYLVPDAIAEHAFPTEAPKKAPAKKTTAKKAASNKPKGEE